ncbi:hypothetical protein niasHT_000933 [Heterodera trifolii]|uniref:Uncharacterized protein n=1 Tax=Heterodera trifolii TaxID=157864 RepID=A0ABD2MD04_9BILA
MNSPSSATSVSCPLQACLRQMTEVSMGRRRQSGSDDKVISAPIHPCSHSVNIPTIPMPPYRHVWVNHTKNVIDPATSACTKMVEGFWKNAKQKNKAMSEHRLNFCRAIWMNSNGVNSMGRRLLNEPTQQTSLRLLPKRSMAPELDLDPITAALAEQERQRTLVFIGLPESNAACPSERVHEDREATTKILDHLEVEAEPTAVFRLGRYDPQRTTPRPLKVVMQTPTHQHVALGGWKHERARLRSQQNMARLSSARR